MGGIGDGVLFKAAFERYVRFGVHHDNQMIFDFGIKQTEKQLEKVKKCINKNYGKAYCNIQIERL